MTKVLPAHATIASLLSTQAIGTPTHIACAGTLLTVAQQTWYPPKHRHVIQDALNTLKSTVANSRVTGKTKLLQDIADTMKSISAQPAEMPKLQNGADDHQGGHEQRPQHGHAQTS